MREQLCHTLAQYMGQTLTSETAVAMVRELFPDRSRDPAFFGIKTHNDFQFQVERLASVLPELHKHHELHYSETEKYRAGIPMNPRYDHMLDRERAGQMLQFTARREGVLVGHLRMYVFESDHTATKVAEEDALFMLPQHRGGFAVMHLMRFAEASLKRLGVREIRANSKLSNRADVLMRRMGYEAVALQFSKVFSEADHE
jgi:hypothetical protein